MSQVFSFRIIRINELDLKSDTDAGTLYIILMRGKPYRLLYCTFINIVSTENRNYMTLIIYVKLLLTINRIT